MIDRDTAIDRIMAELDGLLRAGRFADADKRISEIAGAGSEEEKAAALLITYPARDRLPSRAALESWANRSLADFDADFRALADS